MNFFKQKSDLRKIEFSETTLICKKSLCEDLPKNYKASKVILTVPRICKKVSSSKPYYLKANNSRMTKSNSKLITLGDVNNESFYSMPSFNNSIYKTSASLKILPHRFAVECNNFQRIRAVQKSKPKLRKLIIKLN